MDVLLAVLNAPATKDIALGAIVTLIVVSILRGWIVPVSVLRERIADKDKQITAVTEERNTYRDAGVTKDTTIATLLKQNGDLIEGAETTNRLMEALRGQISRLPGQRQIEGER